MKCDIAFWPLQSCSVFQNLAFCLQMVAQEVAV